VFFVITVSPNAFLQAASSEADALLRDGRKEQEQLVARNKLLHSENLLCNEAIHDLNHTIARRRQELQVYEVKLKDWSRREEIALEVRIAHLSLSFCAHQVMFVIPEFAVRKVTDAKRGHCGCD